VLVVYIASSHLETFAKLFSLSAKACKMAPPPSSQRYCNTCREYLPLDSFPALPPSRLGGAPYTTCKQCLQRRSRRRRHSEQAVTDSAIAPAIADASNQSRRRRRDSPTLLPRRVRPRRISRPTAFAPVGGVCDVQRLDLGPMDDACDNCGALRWRKEGGVSCCKSGDMEIDPLPQPPQFLQHLLFGMFVKAICVGIR
jgi:hypothetical protein